MRFTSKILFALAIALTLGVLAMVARQAKLTPREFFEQVEKRAQEGTSPPEQTISNLDQVLDRAIDVGDVDLAASAQLLRGRTLMVLGAFDRARDDLTAVAAVRPADVAVENDLAELEARSGDYRAAQERVTKLIQRDPANLSSYVRLGRLHRQEAERTVARTLELLERALVAENSQRAREILKSSTALLPSDPRRVALADELRDLLAGSGNALLEGAITASDQACRDLDLARQAFTRSLEHGLDPEAIAGLMDLYEHAGRTAVGVDLGTLVLGKGFLRTDPTFGRAFLSGLMKLGRVRYAADLATLWIRPPPGTTLNVPADVLVECCAVFWQSKRWPELQQAAFLLSQVGSSHDYPSTQLYIGLALIEQGEMRWGRQILRSYMSPDATEPFPKARATAWKYIARASKALAEPLDERFALQGLVELEPELDPEAWLRLADLKVAAPHGGYRDPEMLWARGMSLLPRRTSELMARWGQIGVMELNSLGIDLTAVRSDLAQNKIYAPSADASPYELYRLAELHRDAGDMARAWNYVRFLLEKLPGFIPGLDLAIEVADAQKKPKERMALILERVKRGGRTPAIDKILRDVPLNELANKDKLELMRADPDRTGRLALAEGLAREGRADEALALIEPLASDVLGDEGKILIGRLHLARNAPVRALAVLAPLVPAIYSAPQGLEYLVRAGLAAGDHERMVQLGADLAAIVDTMPTTEVDVAAEAEITLPRERVLWIIDQFLAFGEGEAAQPLLDALDRNPRLRGGDVNLRLVAAAIVRGDVPAAHVALERAQAFDTGGAADYLALLLAAHEGRTEDLHHLAEVALDSGFAKGALLTAQFMLLSDRGAEGTTLLDQGLAKTWTNDPSWNFTAYSAARLREHAKPFQLSPYLGGSAKSAAAELFDAPGKKLDPRLALVWISAFRNRIGVPYVRTWLAEQEKTGAPANLWLEWMRASLDAQWDSTNSALTILQRLHTSAPDFGPAWDIEAAILNATVRPPAEMKAAAARRSAALGEGAGSRIERLLDQAAEKTAAGSFEEALAAANQAIALEPASVAASVTASAIQRQMGDPVSALVTMRTLLDLRAKSGGVASNAKGRFGQDLVAEYLLVLDAARKRDSARVTMDRVVTLLENLRNLLPHDPRIALAQAELELEKDPRNPTLGVPRAYSKLDRFRAAHKRVSMESLGAGSIHGWATFYAKLDPSRARRFVEEELALAPTVLAAWIELARAREAEGDTDGALEQLLLTARLSPHGSVQREILRLRSGADMSYEGITAAVAEIVAAEGASAPDGELSVLEARCIMNQGPRSVERLGQLLLRVDTTTLSPEWAGEHAQLLAAGLLMRGRPEDKATAQPILEGLGKQKLDPYRLGFVDALMGLAKAP